MVLTSHEDPTLKADNGMLQAKYIRDAHRRLFTAKGRLSCLNASDLIVRSKPSESKSCQFKVTRTPFTSREVVCKHSVNVVSLHHLSSDGCSHAADFLVV